MEIRPFSPKDRRYAELSNPGADSPLAASAKAAEMLMDIQRGGDEAWRGHFRETGGFPGASLKVDERELSEARKAVSKEFLTAFSIARVNIRKFHEFQRNRGYHHDDGDGVFMSRTYRPIARAGVLCGKSYSSLLMAAVPAQVAGVGEIVAAAAADADGKIDPHVLAAAATLEIDAVYRMSGAPAVAALALGLGGVMKVDKIVGSDGIMASAAKHALSGLVGVDCDTVPASRIILADSSANARLIASDLLALAECNDHGGSIMVFTTDRLLAEAIRIETDRLSETLPGGGKLLAVLNERGGIFVFADLDAAIDACNRHSPSSLFLMIGDDGEALTSIDNAGIIHAGAWTPLACGDYLGGTNALIPAGGTAGFAHSLGVDDFLAPISVLRYEPGRLVKSGRHAAVMAEAEGRRAVAAAVRERLELLKIAGERSLP